ncbi:hypothetical protein SLNSH_05115 [Alsobacter soli]|uniref:Uncharacterized protein n=1 Tax=Alsobacter soli TaxID=2109933 RepID=A0A2T1HWY5_9HYPH|nr:hypothetical protein SLNSH_05115 [Alsobacter soli]
MHAFAPRSFKWVTVGAHSPPNSLPAMMVRVVDAGPRVLRLQGQEQSSTSWVWTTVAGAPVRRRRAD